jgi:hypothetical protein
MLLCNLISDRICKFHNVLFGTNFEIGPGNYECCSNLHGRRIRVESCSRYTLAGLTENKVERLLNFLVLFWQNFGQRNRFFQKS